MPLQAPIKIQNQGTDVGASYTINTSGALVTSSIVSGIGTLTIAGLSGSTGNIQFNSGTNTFDSDTSFSFNKTTDVLTLTGSIQLGTGTTAAAGLIRLPYNGGAPLSVLAGRGSGGVDENIIQWGAGDSITFGDSSCDFKVNAFGSNSLITSSGGWTFGVSGNSSAVILGSSTNTMVNPLAIGTTPSTTGIIRLPSGQAIKSRDIGNTADKPLMQFTNNILLIGTDSSYSDQVDRLDIYSSTGGNVYIGNGGNTRLALNASGITLYALNDPLTFGYTGASSQGMIRLPGGSRNQIWARNNANSGDIAIISQNISDEVFIGTSNTYANQASNVRIYGTSGVMIGNGSTSTLQVSSGIAYIVGNTALGYQTATFGGGVGVTYVGNANTIPTTNPINGGLLYAAGDRLKYRNSDGYVSSIESIDPSVNGFRIAATTLILSDIASSSTIYLLPDTSHTMALFDGTYWRMMYQNQAANVSLSLSGLTASKNYDVFAYIASGNTIAIELGAAWTSDSVRSVNLIRQNGVLLKSGDLTRRYIGTIRALSATTTADSATQRFVYNEYNQLDRHLVMIPSVTSWDFTPGTLNAYRQAAATTSFRIEFVAGNPVTVNARVVVSFMANAGSGLLYYTGIGINVTTSNSARMVPMHSRGNPFFDYTDATYNGVLSGYNALNWIEAYNHASLVRVLGNNSTVPAAGGNPPIGTSTISGTITM